MGKTNPNSGDRLSHIWRIENRKKAKQNKWTQLRTEGNENMDTAKALNHLDALIDALHDLEDHWPVHTQRVAATVAEASNFVRLNTANFVVTIKHEDESEALVWIYPTRDQAEVHIADFLHHYKSFTFISSITRVMG